MSSTQPPIAVFASFSGSGGVERMLINLLRGFVALGQPVDLILVRAESPHLTRLPAQVNQIRLEEKHTFLAIPALARYLRERRPAALLAVKDRAGRAAVLARMLARTETPILLRLGTNLSTAMAERTPPERWLRYAPIRLLYPRIERIVAVSNGVADDTARIARIPRARIEVIRNPVITPELDTQAAASCAHPWLVPGQPPVILGAGRLQRQKDFPTLIRAFARLRATHDCRLLILGEGSGRAKLEALTARLGLAASVDLPGFQTNPYPFLARAGLFVLSSAWEGSPNVLTEAMALGVPVVATNCPSGPSEILDGGRYGPLVPVGDVAGLAEAMRATLENPLPSAVLRGAVAEYEQSRSAGRYLRALRNAANGAFD
ncbi:glycosyltransferase [Thiocystis violascens]|uniref:Glycosyltransferase n=1 Tax=Thiocystis violascens (strain ATCC 17096 / DSM 198 / 6111) TaxID=765911 RepID=I3YBV8_THIV6|nr:glycosyltransferase [Thiocystis violascens]AFL74476.1 glycosyltransferase [Thiocystis violascens DSM 198]